MENCKASNIAENLFYKSYWKYGNSSLIKKHLYKGLSINSCSVNVSAIKNALSKHQQICSKIPTISAVHVFNPELHPQFHFLRFFLYIWNTFFKKRFLFLLFIFFDCNVSSKDLLSLFLFVSSKNQTPCTFSYKLITFNSNC